MIRVKPTALALCACAVALACGDPDVRQQSATNTPDATYTPAGETTRLRVEAVESTIACDGEPHDVRIWLDDLARAPGPIDATRPTFDLAGGVLSFAFNVSYDPGVAWVADAADVRLGDDLDRAAPDPRYDRNFTLPNVPIDNRAGQALVSPLPVGIFLTPAPSGTPRSWQENVPAGFDPLEAGKPILLATVGLTGMGEGETTVGIDGVKLFAGDNLVFAPDTIIPAKVRVADDCEPFATATPLPVQTEVTLVPPTAFPPSTPAVLTPVPADGIRDDCPAGWAVIDDDAFSACYSNDWIVEFSPQTAPGNLRSYSFTHRLLDTYVGLAVYESTPITAGAVPNLAALCGQLGARSGIDVNIEAVQTSTGAIEMCVGDGEDGLNGFDPVHGYADLRDGLFLQVTAFHGKDDAEVYAVVRKLIATLMLR